MEKPFLSAPPRNIGARKASEIISYRIQNILVTTVSNVIEKIGKMTITWQKSVSFAIIVIMELVLEVTP